MSRSNGDRRGNRRRYDKVPKEDVRIAHGQRRARERDRMAHEEYDQIGTDSADHHHSASWNWW